MNSLTKTFQFSNAVMRTGGTLDDPMFCLRDICTVLGIKNPRDISTSLPGKYKGVHSADTPGGKQSMVFVTEPGVFRILTRTRKKAAEKFQEWLCEEVLPSIRKTGKYENSELVKQNAILKDTTKTQHNLIQAMAKENRQFNITEVLETDRACRNAMSPALANNLAKRHARAHGWKTKDIYTNTERLELISAFRKRLVYDCQTRRVVFAK